MSLDEAVASANDGAYGICADCTEPAFTMLGTTPLCFTHYEITTTNFKPETVRDPDLGAATVDGYRYTGVGNARRLVDLHGDVVRYVPPWGAFLAWDGKRWSQDHHDARTIELAKDVGRLLWSHISAGTATERKELARWAARTESSHGIAEMLRLAGPDDRVRLDHRLLDAHPLLLNVDNGVLHLPSGTLEPHDPELLLTKLAPVRFDKTATCPLWEAFLERVLPDPDVRDFVQRLAGYFLTGEVSEQILVLLIGLGANGKSVFIKLLRLLLGDYAVVAPRDLLLVQKHEPHPTSTASLFGARMAAAVETDTGTRLAEAKVKELTGGDDLTARRMREDFWQFSPTHKLVVAANHRPVITGADEAIWRRVRVVPFTITIPADERDQNLTIKLAAELPGILNWALVGFDRWFIDGLGLPDAVDLATAEYRAEQDVVGQFLDACDYRCQPGLSAPAGELRTEYEQWAEANAAVVLGPVAFANALRSRGLRDVRRNRGRFWDGIGRTPNSLPLTSGNEGP